MSWRPILYSVFKPAVDYGFTIRHSEDKAIGKVVGKLCSDDLVSGGRAPRWIIGEAGGRCFFGRFGLVGEFLGYDHPAAKDDEGRKLEFFLGYSRDAGDAFILPRFSELSHAEEMIRDDLKRFWNDSETKKRAKSDHQLSSASFSGGVLSPHPWDEAIADMSSGQASLQLVIDRQGGTRLISKENSGGRSQAEMPRSSAPYEERKSFQTDEGTNSPKEFQAKEGRWNRRTIVLTAGIVTGLVVILAGWIGCADHRKAGASLQNTDRHLSKR